MSATAIAMLMRGSHVHSLDSNEKSQWRARELKDVNLSKSGKDTRAHFLKLVVHANHINDVNIHSQVRIF
jgi:hypothetical protein